MFKKDNLIWGVLPGLIIPYLTGFAYYSYMSGSLDFAGFFEKAFTFRILSPLLALGCCLNLALFFILIKYNKDKASQGVIAATIFNGIAIVILKFIL